MVKVKLDGFAQVRLLRSTDSDSQHVRMLGTLDGIAGRSSFGTLGVLRQRPRKKLPQKSAQGR